MVSLHEGGEEDETIDPFPLLRSFCSAAFVKIMVSPTRPY